MAAEGATMARRSVHYEAAFEDYVRSQGWPYVPVDEQKKAIFAGARVKSFDFIVYPPGRPAWLVDIKGRKFPYDCPGGKRYWENWVTRQDLEGLRRWEGVFGPGFEPVLVFVYWLTSVTRGEPSSTIHLYRGECYAFVLVSASSYAAHARSRSPKWDTVTVPIRTFRGMISPLTAAG
jgi:hypothetical protein